ncbi:MAG: AI-2E family transporter [Leptolyngbyaceae cyanobacterium]
MKLFDWIGFLGLVISLIILWEFREMLLLLFMAIVLATALNSLVRWLQRRLKLQRGRSVLVTLFIVIVGGGLLTALILPPFIDQVLELGELIPKGIAAVNTWQQTLRIAELDAQLPDWFPPVTEVLDELELPAVGDMVQQIGTIIQQVFGNFLVFFSSTGAIALQILLVVVLTVMILADPSGYRHLLLLLFPSFYRRRADEILTKCEEILLAWMGGVLLSSIFVAISCAVGLRLLNIDLVLAHALLAGLFNVIPNIGPTISVIFPVFVALIDIDVPGKALGVIALYVVVQNLESYWFSPMVMRHQVSMLPAATLVAQLFFASFLGPLGLILALPLAVVSKIWIQEALICDVLDRCQQAPVLLTATADWFSDQPDGQPGDQPKTIEPLEVGDASEFQDGRAVEGADVEAIADDAEEVNHPNG